MSDPRHVGPQGPHGSGGPVSPVNPLPPVVLALFLFVVGIEAVFWLGTRGILGGPGALGWRLGAIQQYAFSGEIFDWMLANNRWPAEHLLRFFSYPFIHAGITQALFAGVMLLALGKMVGEVFAAWAVLAVFLLSGAFGALVYALALDDAAPLLGAFPPVYGLIGAFTFLLWTRLGQIGAQRSRAFTLIGILLGIQLVFGLIFGGNSEWVADISAFAAGFALSILVSPGGWQRLRARLRHE